MLFYKPYYCQKFQRISIYSKCCEKYSNIFKISPISTPNQQRTIVFTFKFKFTALVCNFSDFYQFRELLFAFFLNIDLTELRNVKRCIKCYKLDVHRPYFLARNHSCPCYHVTFILNMYDSHCLCLQGSDRTLTIAAIVTIVFTGTQHFSNVELTNPEASNWVIVWTQTHIYKIRVKLINLLSHKLMSIKKSGV